MRFFYNKNKYKNEKNDQLKKNQKITFPRNTKEKLTIENLKIPHTFNHKPIHTTLDRLNPQKSHDRTSESEKRRRQFPVGGL